MDSKTFTIGVLSLTAVVLLVGLIVVSVMPQPAVASSTSAEGGDYTITAGRVTRDAELLYVINNSAQILVAYGFDRRTGAAAPLDRKELRLPGN